MIEQPTGLILTGDLTLNGEKESLDQMTQTLAPLKKVGIFVFAIPGNHDIHNGWARKFTQDQQLVAHQISPSDFKTAFSDGYEFSVSQDAHSLSYAVDLATYRLVFVDSNLYSETFSKEAPITQG
ncbi:3',5'-cyclic AMP phosphodiesterase CpdA [Enterococcus lemanii]|nr:3',5'-cyclic AMP phosphodiesterase CpdA [Enterococcus lemanii]